MEGSRTVFSILSYSRIVYTLLEKGINAPSPFGRGLGVRVKKQVTPEA
jgi:hypothetical protein